MTEQQAVTIYTDGACLGNPGPGGYGVVLLHAGRRTELSGGYRRTTNNRMELLAVIAGLRTLPRRCVVTVYTDSRYVADAMSKGWARRWRASGWVMSPKTPWLLRPNADQWQELLDLCAGHTVDFKWVKGHAGNVENERCDALAVGAAQQSALPPDAGYEDSNARLAPTLFT
ncbi:MAG: ribonuclease HI [Chloroflexota bacterium]|nr:ribonuclease HI [Chloroflexota bacterium]